MQLLLAFDSRSIEAILLFFSCMLSYNSMSYTCKVDTRDIQFTSHQMVLVVGSLIALWNTSQVPLASSVSDLILMSVSSSSYGQCAYIVSPQFPLFHIYGQCALLNILPEIDFHNYIIQADTNLNLDWLWDICRSFMWVQALVFLTWIAFKERTPGKSYKS